MACEITWTEEAKDDYFNVLKYLLETWNLEVVNEFIGKVNYKLEMIAQNPSLGKISEYGRNVRSVVITSHNKLYYQLYEGSIELLNIFDTRQNPSKNSFK